MSDFKTPSDIDTTKLIGTEKEEAHPASPVKDTTHIQQWANIPKRYKDAKFEAVTPVQEKLVALYRDNFKGKLDDVADMVITGNVGTGKTHVTVGLLNKLIDSGIYCRYTTEHQLLDLYFQKEYKKFDGFKNVKVLCIDEIGKRELQDWQKIQLEELISHRYNEMLPTIFITNMNEKQFKAFVGDRVVDRLRDNNVQRLVMSGDSLRGQHG